MNPSLDDSDGNSKDNCSGRIVDSLAIDQQQDLAVVLRELPYCLSHCVSELSRVEGFIGELMPIGELPGNRITLVRLVGIFQGLGLASFSILRWCLAFVTRRCVWMLSPLARRSTSSQGCAT